MFDQVKTWSKMFDLLLLTNIGRQLYPEYPHLSFAKLFLHLLQLFWHVQAVLLQRQRPGLEAKHLQGQRQCCCSNQRGCGGTEAAIQQGHVQQEAGKHVSVHVLLPDHASIIQAVPQVPQPLLGVGVGPLRCLQQALQLGAG